MATYWQSQQGSGKYGLQFTTDDKEKYKFVEKAAQMAVDGKVSVSGGNEVKHGEWQRQKNGFYFVCSVCGKAAATKGNFCHNCGAEMDGGKKDEKEKPNSAAPAIRHKENEA